MRRWEYRIVERRRAALPVGPGAWDVPVLEIVDLLRHGGWELVTVVPWRGGGLARSDGPAALVTEEVWVLRRPSVSRAQYADL